MIFIVFFLIIVFIIIALNLHNQTNLNEIEEYLQKNNCQNIVYAEGSYKALCDDYLINVENSFTLDINKNSKIINYAQIKDIKTDKTQIVINDENKIKFKTQEKLNLFLTDLEKKLNK